MHVKTKTKKHLSSQTLCNLLFEGRDKHKGCLQDWLDIDFAIQMNVDFIAVSFVKTADVINNLKSYLSSRCDKVIEIVAKIESHDSVPNAQDIIEASDAVMIARGDLGKALPYACYLLKSKLAGLRAIFGISHLVCSNQHHLVSHTNCLSCSDQCMLASCACHSCNLRRCK